MPKPRVVVLASGSGTLFAALAQQAAPVGIDLVLLVTDRPAPVEDRAAALGIPVERIMMEGQRDDWDQRLLAVLEAADPDWIVSAGYMRLIGPAVLSRFQGRIINSHPALLPAFPGAHAVRDALAAGATVTGCTVHFVDAGMDTGPVIRQVPVPIMAGDDEVTLHERIKTVERGLLVEVVRELARGTVRYPQDA